VSSGESPVIAARKAAPSLLILTACITRRKRVPRQHGDASAAPGIPAMAMIRMRISGKRDNIDTLIGAIGGIDGIEHVEDVDEESMDEMRDDSSSSDLVDDSLGDVVRVEIEAPAKKVELVRNVALLATRELDIAVEFVDEF